MSLHVITDHDAIRALLADVIAADPVRGTVLGTISTSLEVTAWYAGDDVRFAVRSSADHPLALVGPWDETAVGELAALVAAAGGVQAVSGVVDAVELAAPVLFDGRPTATMDQLLFRLDELSAPTDVPGGARLAEPADRDTVRRWYLAFADEADLRHPGTERSADTAVDGGHCHVWCDPAGEPVSMAARRPVIAGSSRIGPVYTPPAHRRRGYGAAVTAASTRSILDESAVPVLFTDVANPTSNRIYQEIGYRPVEYRRVVRLR